MSVVVFKAEDHSYTLEGVRLPSVTQILARCYDFARVDPVVLAAKAELGTAVHVACELDDANDLVESSVHPRVRPYLDGYRLFKQQKRPNVIATEQIVHHRLFGYAGKFDLLADFDGARWLIDWKTPLTISPAVALQTAAYQQALDPSLLPGTFTRKRAALQLTDDGRFKLHEFADPNDWPTFVAFTTAHHWQTRNLK